MKNRPDDIIVDFCNVINKDGSERKITKVEFAIIAKQIEGKKKDLDKYWRWYCQGAELSFVKNANDINFRFLSKRTLAGQRSYGILNFEIKR